MSKLLEYLEARRHVELSPDATDDDCARVGATFVALPPALQGSAMLYVEGVRWIPVEVELPPRNIEVLVARRNGRVSIMGSETFHVDQEYSAPEFPTHWALLPKPPRKP